mmetsp:Transcript_24674/g.49531  ORF Transcript_24674/g.49531 Transcript_24674/m.49531 type:complete len:157 (+) Transcript_24674:189-659(+)
MKAALQKYSDSRQQLINSLQHLMSLRNKMSYVSADMLRKQGAVTMKSSRLTFQLSDSIDSATMDCKEKLLELSRAVSYVKELTLAKDNNSFVDESYMAALVSELEQQYILECSITEGLCSNPTVEIDQDSVTSMMACFEYPPYLSDAKLEAFLLTC